MEWDGNRRMPVSCIRHARLANKARLTKKLILSA